MSRENRQVDYGALIARLETPAFVIDPRGAAKPIYRTPDGPEAAKALRQTASDLEQVKQERDEAVRLLRPFAVYYEINDCDERDADDAIEVPIGDLRLARAFLNNMDNRDGRAT